MGISNVFGFGLEGLARYLQLRIKRDQQKKSKRERRWKMVIKEAGARWEGYARLSTKMPLHSTGRAGVIFPDPSINCKLSAPTL